ncbi:MAG: class I SAM-dependent methyltransferase [Planctomycetes bacterium]|nr:class I SAM-dependent methyltransferase [Planctomycetota bacterium]
MNTPTIKHHYQDEAVATSYDQERFTSLSGRTFDRLEKRAIRKLLEVARRQVAHPEVLDAPCGTGRITELLLEQGFQVTGGDISLPMINAARHKCARFNSQVDFRCLDLDAIELPDNSFDLVTCIRLFHHLETEARTRILKELARVSKRYVLINVSFSSGYYRVRRRAKRLLGQGVSTASSTWDEIRLEMAAAGLQIESSRFLLRYFSENLLLLLTKAPQGNSQMSR